MVRLCVRAGAFKFGVDREEPFVKLFKLYPEPLEIQEVKLRFLQTAAFEIDVERLTESPMRSNKEVAQVVIQRGEECIEGNPFFLHWSETVGVGFWGGSAHVKIKCNGEF